MKLVRRKSLNDNFIHFDDDNDQSMIHTFVNDHEMMCSRFSALIHSGYIHINIYHSIFLLPYLNLQ